MPRVSREDIARADDRIYDILYEVKDPKEGYTVREIVRRIWGKDKLRGESFYTYAKLIERRLGAYRHRAYRRIRERLREKSKSDNPVRGKKLPKPSFLPYALPTGEQDRYWRYFNAVEHKIMPLVIEKLRKKADGMNANADVLDSVF